MEEKKTVKCECEKKPLINRVNRISGQINGIKQMIEDDRYCADILTQIAAAKSALNTLGTVILDYHIKHCLVNDIKNDNLESIDELVELMKRLS